ncbi:MAG: hypothetical protein QOG15_2755 [Solirubrobacteraceae bacterium]|jgi:hypothetical protein|nr:hypothetical protein [Solirubrobacteraceae bacterium]
MNDGVAEGGGAALRRLRWRLRGAVLWPAFALLTVLDAAVMHWLPIAGEGTRWVPALLLAGCLNVAAVALFGGLGGLLLRRLRPSLPKVVADDSAGTAVLGVLGLVFLTAGLVHRPEVESDRNAFSEQSFAVRRWVESHGDAFTRAHVDLADSVRIDANLYRTCVPGLDPRRFLCLVVDTTRTPPLVRRDTNRESNASLTHRTGYR